MKEVKINSIYKYLGHIGFWILLLLSVLFYKERILFNDTVFQFFKIVNFEKFNIEAMRYSTVITQIPVLIALKLNNGLRTLLMIYSISFVVVYYMVFILCIHVLKNPAAGIAILFSLIICITESFFHPCTETHQAIVYSILLYAILQYNFNPKWGILKYIFGHSCVIVFL